MPVTRTPDVDVDQDFVVDVPITKAYVDSSTGERHIVGVATGVAEDRDGERCSKNCVVYMGKDIEGGDVKVTSSHQQDWMTEIGDVRKYTYDADTDEMVVDGVLPPEGVDAIADKGWREAQNGNLGWSIGGKLLKSYFERNEVGKKRKVLDRVKLRHLCLTRNPSYAPSFAQAVVAKTWSDQEAPGDDEFTLDVDPAVEKDLSSGSWASGSSDSGGGNTGRDSAGSGKRNAGSRKPGTKGMNTEDGSGDDDNNDDADLPKAKNERHLACPNCGHEFAADLPLDSSEQQGDDLDNANDDEDEDRDTGKSVEKQVSTILQDTLSKLQELVDADGAAVHKTPDESPKSTPDVAKVDELSDVQKMVAASHVDLQSQLTELSGKVGEAFELVAKSHQGIVALIGDMPQGRKSVARLHPGGEGTPPPNGHEESTGGPETVAKQIEGEENPLAVLKTLNAANWGVSGNQRGILAH